MRTKSQLCLLNEKPAVQAHFDKCQMPNASKRRTVYMGGTRGALEQRIATLEMMSQWIEMGTGAESSFDIRECYRASS